MHIVPLIAGDERAALRLLPARARARRVRAGDSPTDGAGRHLPPAPHRDGFAHACRAARSRGRTRCRGAARRDRARADARARAGARRGAGRDRDRARPRRTHLGTADAGATGPFDFERDSTAARGSGPFDQDGPRAPAAEPAAPAPDAAPGDGMEIGVALEHATEGAPYRAVRLRARDGPRGLNAARCGAARPVRHGNRHGSGQDGPQRVPGRGDARGRRARTVGIKPVITGLDERPRGKWPADDELLAAVTGHRTRGGFAAALRARRLAAPRGRARRRGDRPEELVSRDPRRGRAGAAWRSWRASAGCSSRCTAPGRARPRGRARAAARVAARPGLGTISHTLLTLEAARCAGCA